MFPLSGTWFTAIGLAFFFHGCDLVCQGKLPSAYQGQRYPPFSVTVIWRAKLTCNPIRPSSDTRHAHLLLAVLTIWENLSTFSIAPVKKPLGVYLIHFFLISDKQPMSKYCWLYTQHLSRMWPLFTTWIAMTSDPSAISHIGHSIAFLWVSKLALQFLNSYHYHGESSGRYIWSFQHVLHSLGLLLYWYLSQPANISILFSRS